MSKRPSTVPSSHRKPRLTMSATAIAFTLGLATSADAAIVVMDLGPTGLNLLGPQANVANFSSQSVNNFPVSGSQLFIVNNAGGMYGFEGDGTLQLAVYSTSASMNPRNYGFGSSIDATGSFTGSATASRFKDVSFTSPDFGPNSYMGFRVQVGTDFMYGWMEVTWTGATNQFEILAAAYETDLNTSILAGATGGGVPLPGAAGLAACGLLGLGRRPRR